MSPGLASWREAGSYLDHGAHRIFWRQKGSGPPLLLIHGFPTASWDWHLLLDSLAADYRVMCFDLLGFGYSAKPWPHVYSIAEQADLCEAVLAHCDVHACHVLAHDYGDTVAQELLARHNSGRLAVDLTSLCLLNGGLFPETHRARLVQRLLAGPFGGVISRLMSRRSFDKTMKAIFGTGSQPSPQELADFWALVNEGNGRVVMSGLIRYMAERIEFRERWVGALRATSVPIRLIDGVADPISGAHMVSRYRELVPGHDVVELAGVGHYPQIEAPDQVLAAYREFLVRVDVKSVATD